MDLELMTDKEVREALERVKQAVHTIMAIADEDTVRDKAFRNAAKLIQNAIDGEYFDFELISEQKESIKWPSTDDMSYACKNIPESCRHCSNHPINGGSGICWCTLGTQTITTTYSTTGK